MPANAISISSVRTNEPLIFNVSTSPEEMRWNIGSSPVRQ
jgi:hypothetical protein